jgi:hypothetical protein
MSTQHFFNRDMIKPGRMVYIVDTEKREIRVKPGPEPVTLAEVRAYIDKVYKGTEVVAYTVHFLPSDTQGRKQNAMAAMPEDIEFKFRKDHTITNL